MVLASEQMGGQSGGGLPATITVPSRTLLELFETSAEATVNVASVNVRVINMFFIGNSLFR